jgi:PTH1 family peptidyl-tRNA hydrolase
MRQRKLIVGLGNPGTKYARTRHNLGFMAADALAASLNADFRKKSGFALLAEAEYTGHAIIIAKPQLYMNRSGESVGQLVRYLNIGLEELLVVVDDADLPLGKLRLRKQGSAGGHNGLKSIIDHLGSTAFPRLRLGMGRPEQAEGMVDHVLSDFSRGEQAIVRDTIQQAVHTIRTFLEEGIEQAMNSCNAL